MTSGERWRLVAVAVVLFWVWFWVWFVATTLARIDQSEKQCKDKGGVPVAHSCLKKDAVIQ